MLTQTDATFQHLYHGQVWLNIQNATIKGWVARDKDGSLYFYDHKPIRDNEDEDFVEQNADAYLLHDGLDIPSITWNDEPIEAELTIKIKNK